MKIVWLLLGSVSTILLAVQLFKGERFYYLLDNLEGENFPIKYSYCVGLAWNELDILSLKGKVKEKLVGQAKLLYDPKYAEYYATIAWAQMLSFIHLGLTVGFVLAGILDSTFMVIIGIALAAVFGYYFLNKMNSLLKTRETECTAELPELVSTMALLINAGMMLRNAWQTIAESKEGEIYRLMRLACNEMENGMSEVDAIHKFGVMSSSAEVRKFTSSLIQSIERGGGELTSFLGRQSTEMWTLKKQLMLQKGEAASSKLLAPTAMLFVGIIIAVITGAIGMLI